MKEAEEGVALRGRLRLPVVAVMRAAVIYLLLLLLLERVEIGDIWREQLLQHQLQLQQPWGWEEPEQQQLWLLRSYLIPNLVRIWSPLQ
jgi:hypothetical protein